MIERKKHLFILLGAILIMAFFAIRFNFIGNWFYNSDPVPSMQEIYGDSNPLPPMREYQADSLIKPYFK